MVDMMDVVGMSVIEECDGRGGSDRMDTGPTSRGQLQPPKKLSSLPLENGHFLLSIIKRVFQQANENQLISNSGCLHLTGLFIPHFLPHPLPMSRHDPGA